MRVLAVGNMYPPHHFGGYELVWRSAMLHLQERGHEVRVLASDFRIDTEQPDHPGVGRVLRWYWRDHGFPRLPRLERLRIERANAHVLDHELDEVQPDVVTWWSMGGMSLSMLERVRRRGIPALAFVHDDWLQYGPEVDGWTRPFATHLRPVAPLVERLTGVPTRVDLPRAARYVFVSDATRRRAADAGIEPASAGIAHSGIDPGFLEAAPERDWSWSLLYVGRIDERKGVETAVAALAHLPAEATLDVVGGWDADEEIRVRTLARRHGVEARLRFRGQVSREEVREAYARADAVVFPVIWEEPWGLVPLEAMARGRPVVATGRGGSGEYLRDGENALLFDAEDAGGLADALRRLSEDRELRRRLVAGGLETAPRHTEQVFNSAVLREIEAIGSGRH